MSTTSTQNILQDIETAEKQSDQKVSQAKLLSNEEVDAFQSEENTRYETEIETIKTKGNETLKAKQESLVSTTKEGEAEIEKQVTALKQSAEKNKDGVVKKLVGEFTALTA